jgi:hypothetical protein
MKRIGTVLTFKPEVTEEEAARALRSIAFILDTPSTINKPTPEIRAALDAGHTIQYQPGEWSPVPFEHADLVHEFDDDWGGPVWYIP